MTIDDRKLFCFVLPYSNYKKTKLITTIKTNDRRNNGELEQHCDS